MKISKKIKSYISPIRVLSIIILINLVVGIYIVQDFGISVDEEINGTTSWISINSYTLDHFKNRHTFEIVKYWQFYGTGLSMFYELAEYKLAPIFHTDPKVILHYCYFLTFQAAIISLFFLSKRFVKEWVALSVTLLFTTQPLFFGHAFINPKDIPLLSIVLVTIVTGLSMADQFSPSSKLNANKFISDIANRIKQDIDQLESKRIVWLTVANGLLASLFIFSNQIKLLLGQAIESVYFTSGNTLIGKVFLLAARNKSTIPVHTYVQKIQFLYQHYLLWVVLGCISIQVYYFILPKVSSFIVNIVFNGLDISGFLKLAINRKILLAAFMYGLCISTRSIGIVAGGMVALYFILEYRRNAVGPLLIYGYFAALSAYILWPILWTTGIKGIFTSLNLLTHFPWEGWVLFKGTVFFSKDLPKTFIPTLMTLQFTEPMILFGFFGLLVALSRKYKTQPNKNLLLVIYCWYFLPILYILLTPQTMYDNFRQYFFITPPLFIFAGIGLEKTFDLISDKWLKLSIIGSSILIGIISIISLHPYQYIYYNSFTGGVSGAFRNYELDYWGIAFKDAMDFINKSADEGEIVYSWTNAAQFYQQGDYQMEFGYINNFTDKEIDYAIIPTRANMDFKYFTGAETLYEVTLNDVLLAIVKKVN